MSEGQVDSLPASSRALSWAAPSCSRRGWRVASDDDYRFVFVCLEAVGRLGEELREDGFPVHVPGKAAGC